MFFTSFAVGITNPAAVLTFLFAFSWFGITGKTGAAEGTCLVCGVFIGTYIWWGTLSGTVTLLKKKAKKNHQRGMNRIFGFILTLFGAAVLIDLLKNIKRNKLAQVNGGNSRNNSQQRKIGSLDPKKLVSPQKQ